MNGLFLKRVFDFLTVIIAAPVWLPLLLVLAVLVRVKLGAPVFSGRNGREGTSASSNW